LNSRSNLFPDGLANFSGQVGRNLVKDTACSVSGSLPQLEGREVVNEDGYRFDIMIHPCVNIDEKTRSKDFMRRYIMHMNGGFGVGGGLGRPSQRSSLCDVNMAEYGHTREAVPGVSLLGKSHICQVHVNNDGFLIEQPTEINWSAALEEFNKIGYKGRYVFGTHRRNPADLRQSTITNIAFLWKHCRMPLG
jgi:hypothetical protein